MDHTTPVPPAPNIIDGELQGFEAWHAWAVQHEPTLRQAAKIVAGTQLTPEDTLKFSVYFSCLAAAQGRNVVYDIVNRLGEEAVFGPSP